jgi:CRP-like cAMP-binding protein
MEGEAAVLIKTGDERTLVATLRNGQFFGEMSLLTGAARSATVQAVSQLTVAALGKLAMSQVLSRNRNLADQFGAILAARQSDLVTTRDAADRAAKLKAAAGDALTLTSRIRRFFHLS